MSSPFDEEKYKRLLEGLEISEVWLSEIDLGDRIDADYYTKENLSIEAELKRRSSVELRGFAEFVASAFYPAATQLYEVGDTPFIRCVDCINYPLITKKQDDAFEKIPMYFVEENDGINLLNKNDIVITKVGSPCYASIVYEHDVVALSRTVMGLKNIHGINPFYLLVFLRSKYGFSQLLRARELTIQYQLTLERVKRVLVYVPNDSFQKSVEKIVKESIEKQTLSQTVYSEAENLLLTELGLKGWRPNNAPVNIKQLKESYLASGRLDAEYYQPKYDALFAQLSKYKCDTIKGIAHIKKSVEPGSEAYQDSGIPFVRVSAVSKFGISEPNVFLSPNDFSLKELQPKKDTILLSKDGSVGIAYKVEEDMNCITSGALLHLSVFNQDYTPDYLTLVLNSIVVQMQADRDSNGAIIQHWKPSEIEQVIIPKLPKPIQETISAKIQESFALKAESKRLLDEATMMVEREIEKGGK